MNNEAQTDPKLWFPVYRDYLIIMVVVNIVLTTIIPSDMAGWVAILCGSILEVSTLLWAESIRSFVYMKLGRKKMTTLGDIQ